MDDPNRLIQEIFTTSRTLAELERDGLDEAQRLREELRQRRRELLDRLKNATAPDLAAIDVPFKSGEPPKRSAKSKSPKRRRTGSG